ncbi:MAG TPA: ABC transporter ATP-binding protein, partial [Acidimicrobiales bacterium]|nr:ABC transporter ATP-binding protein [Acidimicrobiales bacterium]
MTQDPLETPVSPDGGSVGSSSLTGDVAPDRLACFGVTVRFGGLVAVNDVDLAVPPSTIVGLVGPNGAGKSTLFGVLSGLLPPTHGRVVLDGEDITDSRPQLRAARGLARTFQHPELFTGLTVRDHLVLSYRAKHARGRIWSDMFTMGSLKPSSPQETETIGDLIDLLGLSFLANTPALGLPLGMSRLVEIGRALAASPTVLLLDEPSSGLDSAESTQFEQTLRMVASERGISVLLVEHDVELVMRLCKTVYVLDFGALIASGSPADIRANHAVRSAYLGEEVADAPSSSVRSSAEGTDTNGEVLEAEAALGRSELPDAASDGGTTLTVDNLTVHYGEAVALEG